MASLQDLRSTLGGIRKQIPFATAQALTNVARQIEQGEKKGLQRQLENPTPFTVNAVRSTAARKTNLTAKVFVMDTAASYLDPFEFGGLHKLNGKALLNPKNIRLNKYGNLARNKLAQLKANPNDFIGTVTTKAGKSINGVWQRRKGRKVKSRRKRSPNGERRERKKQRAPKLLLRFGNALPVKEHLDYFARANKMAEVLMPSALSQAMAEALRTAK
ncbi:hypothetical protein C3Z09_22340 [Lelliottia aquatilis]|uniref:hypothetical protein n=1 Tax=Lelliottia aquatilis TaxID=2080838 RepID=UPI000CDED75A|nr:hypothetical protein [Lelliottia aquatilis]NTZ48386.1 hypothetical protein [Lelliottia aquatilis]POZ13679.1 hypothetical protein C3Z09_22340 [Lelliottia aquatilis]